MLAKRVMGVRWQRKLLIFLWWTPAPVTKTKKNKKNRNASPHSRLGILSSKSNAPLPDKSSYKTHGLLKINLLFVLPGRQVNHGCGSVFVVDDHMMLMIAVKLTQLLIKLWNGNGCAKNLNESACGVMAVLMPLLAKPIQINAALAAMMTANQCKRL